MMNQSHLTRVANSFPRGRVIRRAHKRRRGVAAVEMALVLPLLLLLMLGATDLGRFAHYQIAVANSARVGAGVGAITPFTSESRTAWETHIRRAVQSEMEGVRGFESSRLSVRITPQSDSEGRQRVQVEVTYPFAMLVHWGLLPDIFPIKQSSTFPVIR